MAVLDCLNGDKEESSGKTKAKRYENYGCDTEAKEAIFNTHREESP